MNDSRSEQFKQWAKVVYEMLAQNVLFTKHQSVSEIEAFKQEQETILARAGYALVEHSIENADYSGIAGWIKGVNIPLYHKVVQSIPDMPELSKEQGNEI